MTLTKTGTHEDKPVHSGCRHIGYYGNRKRRLHFVCCLFLLVTWSAVPIKGSEPENKQATQCIRQKGITFVSLYCGDGKVIRVKEAFHGVHRSHHSSYCGPEPGDCTADADNLYDWTRCESRNSCVQLVEQSSGAPQCGGLRPSYLQVTYTCVTGEATSMKPLPPVTTRPKTVMTDINDVNKQLPVKTATPEMTIKAANICLNKTVHLPELYIQSPGFPEFYPAGLDCRCEVRASQVNSITVRFDEVKLSAEQSGNGRRRGRPPLCDDWLMLEAPEYKGAGVVVCQDVDSRRKSLQSRSSHIVLHLHTTPGLGVWSRRGFRILIKGSDRKSTGEGTPAPPLDIDCYQTSAEVALNSLPPGAAYDPSRPYALPPTNFGSASSQVRGSSSEISSNKMMLNILMMLTCLRQGTALGVAAFAL